MENNQPKQIQKSGAVVLHEKNSELIALIFRGKEKDWSFPKGHIEIDEEPINACIWEVKEEIGLDVEIITKLPNNEYLHKNGNKIITQMYLVRSKGGDFKIERPEDKIEWVQLDEVENKLAYDNLKKYYSEILPIIKNI